MNSKDISNFYDNSHNTYSLLIDSEISDNSELNEIIPENNVEKISDKVESINLPYDNISENDNI